MILSGKYDYDVVVVGAGPAGSAAAKTCAEKGLDVAMIEKLPAPFAVKRCGEGLSNDSVKLIGQKIPPECIARKINGAIVYSPRKKAVIDLHREAGYILERKLYDKWLAAEAARAGVYVQTKTTATGVVKKDGFVKGVEIEFEGEKSALSSRVVVAADGVESVISRMAGLKTTNNLVNIFSAYQFEMVGIEMEDPDKIIIYVGNKISPRGYIWIFPKGEDVANVGIGIGGLGYEKTARGYLEDFIKSDEGLKKGSIVEVNTGAIPAGGFMDNMVLNGLVAVGDAAHQVNPLHGGGIKEATLGGMIAGGVIAECIEKDDVSQNALSEYNKIWWEQHGKRLRNIEKARNVIAKLSDEDLDMLVESVTGDDIVDFTRGKKLEKVAQILLRKPGLITLARHLL